MVLLVFVIACFGLLLTRHSVLEEAARESLEFVGKALIPALFPFAVLSRFVLTASLLPCRGKIAQKTAKALHIAPSLLPAYLLGLFCGFPIGAYAASSLYEADLCEKNAAYRSASLSNNASAAFLFSTAASLFSNRQAAFVLLFSQSAATILVSLFSRQKSTSFKEPLPKKTSYLSLAADTISKSGIALLSLSAFVVFFAVLTKALLLVGLPSCITLILEPISAVRYAASLIEVIGQPASLSLAAFALGFSGISVIMQAQALFHGKLPLRKQILTRLAIALLSCTLAFLTASLFCS